MRNKNYSALHHYSSIIESCLKSFKVSFRGSSSKNPLRVVSLGCGNGPEIPALITHLENICGKDFVILGLDSNASSIERAKETFRDDKRIHFDCIDASDIEDVKKSLTNSFSQTTVDLVVFSNPVMDDGFGTTDFLGSSQIRDPALRAFSKMVNEIVPTILELKGTVMGFFYSKTEQANFTKLFQGLITKGTQILTGQSKHASTLPCISIPGSHWSCIPSCQFKPLKEQEQITLRTGWFSFFAPLLTTAAVALVTMAKIMK